MSETIQNDAPRKAFYAALAKAQAKIEGALKDKTNPGFKSKYADLGAVWEACREPLTSNGIAVMQFPDYDAENGIVSLQTILTHTDGYDKDFMLSIPVSKRDAQGIGSAITYARRYALMAAVGIAPEDDDGNAAVSGNGVPAPKSASQSLGKGPASRDLYAELQDDIQMAESLDALEVWATRRKADVATLPADWQDALRRQYADKKTYLMNGDLQHAAE